MKRISVLVLVGLTALLIMGAGCMAKEEPAVQEYSDAAFAANGNGLAAYMQKNYTQALGYFDEAIATDPDFSKAWSNRGLTLIALGRYGEAADSFNRTLEIDPSYPGAAENRDMALSRA